LISLLVLMGAPLLVAAQESSGVDTLYLRSLSYPRVGLGVGFGGTGASFEIPIVFNDFRIHPSFSASRSTSKETVDPITFPIYIREFTTTSFSMNCGVFYNKWVERSFTWFAGLVGGYSFGHSQSTSDKTPGEGDPRIDINYEAYYEGFRLGVGVGGECMISSRLSLGSDLSVIYSYQKEPDFEPDDARSGRYTETRISPSGGCMLRWYFN
jgi:hypothetical protein